jgi:hypothetical protein
MMPAIFDEADSVLEFACNGEWRGARLVDLATADLKYLRWRFGKNPAFRHAADAILMRREAIGKRRAGIGRQLDRVFGWGL